MRRRSVTVALGLTCAALLGAACSGKTTQAGGLEVIITTDLAIPSEFDEFTVDVQQQIEGGAPYHFDFPVPQQPLPASLAIQSGASGDNTVVVTVTALLGGVPVDVREVEVQVPTTYVAELTMLLSQACFGRVTTAAGPACPTGESCQPTTGACGTNVVSMLDPYTDASVGPVVIASGFTSADAGVDGTVTAPPTDGGTDVITPDTGVDTGVAPTGTCKLDCGSAAADGCGVDAFTASDECAALCANSPTEAELQCLMTAPCATLTAALSAGTSFCGIAIRDAGPVPNGQCRDTCADLITDCDPAFYVGSTCNDLCDATVTESDLSCLRSAPCGQLRAALVNGTEICGLTDARDAGF